MGPLSSASRAPGHRIPWGTPAGYTELRYIPQSHLISKQSKGEFPPLLSTRRTQTPTTAAEQRNMGLLSIRSQGH